MDLSRPCNRLIYIKNIKQWSKFLSDYVRPDYLQEHLVGLGDLYQGRIELDDAKVLVTKYIMKYLKEEQMWLLSNI